MEHLLLVVPFIVQIMMAAGQSRVFRPPNPWTRAIIKALRRTYHRTNVNLSVKYEIEVLCRHLGLSSTLHSVSQDDPADARGDRALESWAADALCCLQRITGARVYMVVCLTFLYRIVGLAFLRNTRMSRHINADS